MYQEIYKKLDEYKNNTRFTVSEWEKRGRDPFPPEIIDYMELLVNVLIKQFSQQPAIHEVRKIFKNFLKAEKKFFLSINQKDRLADFYSKLSIIVDGDVNRERNAFLYGKALSLRISTVHHKNKN